MIREVFTEGSSPIHRIDHRSRVVTALCFSVIMAIAHSFTVLMAGLSFSILLSAIACLSISHVLKRLSSVFLFLIIIWIFLPLSFQGEPLFTYGILSFKRGGVLMASAISLKSMAIVLAFMCLVATMTVADLSQALSRIGMPSKIVFLLLMTYRYIFVLESEYRRLLRSVKVRGFKSGLTLHTFKTYAYIAGMLFVRASVRAERVHQAMKCRGFIGRFHSIRTPEEGGRNKVFAGIVTVFLICLVVMDHFFI